MLTFDPISLRSDLEIALAALEEVISHQWFDLCDPNFDPAVCDDEVVTLDTVVEGCGLWSAEHETDSVTVRDLLCWSDALRRFQLRDRTLLRLGNESLFNLASRGEVEHSLASAVSERKIEVAASVALASAEFAVSIQTGLTMFAVFVEAEGGLDDHLPSYYDTSLVLNVKHAPDATDGDVLAAARSFLFELAATTGLVFTIEPYPQFEEWDDSPQLPQRLGELRPLSMGPGLTDVHELFLLGASANSADNALVQFVKVIEYVSATVIRITRHDAIRRRLSTRLALSPDAEFLDDLASLIEEQRVFSKDAEALRLTVQTCCDPVLLARDAPPCLSRLRVIRQDTEDRQKRAALDELSNCLSSTRNLLSHAKANYALSGAECPSQELQLLADCARCVAEQVIRWFAQLPPSNRVV